MKIFKITLVFGLLAALSLNSCKKDYGIPPELPPEASFVTDFSDFDNSNKFLGDTTSLNWVHSALNVGVWNVVITVGLAVPIASYVEAVKNNSPVYQSDNTWLWEYSFTDIGANVYTAKL